MPGPDDASTVSTPAQGEVGVGEVGVGHAGAGADGPGADSEGMHAPDIVRDGPAAALARARAAARAKGMRPGKAGRRRRKDLPEGAARILDDGRDPRLLGEELDVFLTERGWRGDVAVGSVIGRWAFIVGPEVAEHCQPTDFTDGVLTIRAESTAWATQLGLLSSTLQARLTEDVGEGVVTQIRIVGPSAPTWSKGALRVSKGRGPRDTYG